MELKDFKTQADELIEQFQEVIDELPLKGDTSEECQRMTLQNALNNLDSCVSGTKEADMKEDPEATHYCTECGWEGTENELGTTTDMSQTEIQYGKCCPECRSEEIEEH